MGINKKLGLSIAAAVAIDELNKKDKKNVKSKNRKKNKHRKK